jgi:hypothetical protein
MTIYGWYSEEAFQTNKIGYLYTDKNNISKLCTIVSDGEVCPYYQSLNIYKETVVFVGELNKFICPIHYHGDTEKDKIENILNDANTYEILNKSVNNRRGRLLKLSS